MKYDFHSKGICFRNKIVRYFISHIYAQFNLAKSNTKLFDEYISMGETIENV